MENRLFTKDFTLVVIGQIISLFGNAAIRFALPLYLLNRTGSSALYGTVMACAFVPAILLSPVGGLIADRVNKRNVMVILDFSAAGLILLFMLLMDRVNLVLVLTLTLMILYGIAGAYQPTVQASIPALVNLEHFMRANAVINLFLSAMITVALPYLITEVLPFSAVQANKLYGYAQGTLAAGGIAGAIGAGIFADRLQINKAGNLLILGSICIFPIGLSLWWSHSSMLIYCTITICCFVIMSISTVFSVQMMAFVQTQTPQNLIGKVMAVLMTGAMCAQPFGNAMYGLLFEICAGHEAVVVFFAAIVSLLIACKTRKVFLML